MHFENMRYQRIIFPSNDGKPYVAEYGCQMIKHEDENLVGVHIRPIGDLVDLHEDGATRDRLLNKILEKEFIGVCARLIRVLVSGRGITKEYFLSAQEFHAVRGEGQLTIQPVDVYASDVRAGETWLKSMKPRLINRPHC